MFSALSYSTVSSSGEETSYRFELEQKITHEFENKLTAAAQKLPVVILIGGFQGSGKSSLIRRIAEAYDINVISTDFIRQSLFDRGIKVSPEFSKYLKAICSNLLKKCLKMHSNIAIDANSHSSRIAEMEKLLQENNSHYSVVKIFLDASEVTLQDRIKARKPTLNCYQGTESDLEAAFASIKVDPKEYDLILNTDKLSQSNVFELVNDFISPYFKLQNG